MLQKSSMTETLVDIRVDAYVRLVRTAERIFNDVSRGLVEHGLTASQFSALKVLCLRGPMPQKDVATNILKSTGNVTMVIDNLEKEGLVERTRGSLDRRIFEVAATQKGKDLFHEVYAPHLGRIREAMGDLNQEECEQLIGLLERLGAVPLPPCID
jgi:MarR family 2-MHQ and catechol resistance regulon transcriptional repressor